MKQQELVEIEPEPPSTFAAGPDNSFLSNLPENIAVSDSFFSYTEKHYSPELVTDFREKHFPGVSLKDWNNWRWQIKNRICRAKDLEKYLKLSPAEKAAAAVENLLPLSVTPYYMSLVHQTDSSDPVRKCVIPNAMELIKGPGEEDDPLHEDRDSPVPGIIHRYPDRVLFLSTGFCSTYCRYCTRSRIVGQRGVYGIERWKQGVDYVQHNPQVRDVLISGGDPLTMHDNQIEYLLKSLRQIRHVEIIRIGTKVPAVLPQRITKNLCAMLKKYHPLYMSLHFTHPRELTNESMKGCFRLAQAGIPLGAQTVLLKGVNDEPEIMKRLNNRLLQARVRPYYLYQCDPVPGSGHFRTTIKKGLDIIQGLRGHTSGYAVPQYVIDLPGGGGKTPVLPGYYQNRSEYGHVFKNFENKVFFYPELSAGNDFINLNLISADSAAGGRQ
ncbi:MAG: KamA family radical SAM protein [Desulfonatronovibrio sp. MSAO_Bac4]|nr:MAG: KamA family radical SAM protein [Desulfonatronovibrio sp. MSAO_Bac4]